MTKFFDAVDEFFCDSNTQYLIANTREDRSLQICFPKEINICRLLAWLFNPSEGHGLSDMPIRNLLTQAWMESSTSQLGPSVRNKIAPRQAQTSSYTQCLVTSEFPVDGGRIDLLIIDPEAMRVIALETKFGAKQTKGQLSKYRKALMKLFKEWDLVLIYLDSQPAMPADENWISLDDTWLVELLEGAEASSWTPEASKATLREFRQALDGESGTHSAIEKNEERIWSVSSTHKIVLAQMSEWEIALRKKKVGLNMPLLYERLRANLGTKDGKAKERLFRIYWQKQRLWDACMEARIYADIVPLLKKRFPSSLEFEWSRVNIFFCLDQWQRLLPSNSNGFSPIQVIVRRMKNEEFRVSCGVLIEEVADEDHVKAILSLAEDMRVKYFKRRTKIKKHQEWIRFRTETVSGIEKATTAAGDQIFLLQSALKEKNVI